MTPIDPGKEEEIRRYESYVKADPENELIWINLGDLYHQSGDFEKAIACFEKCLTFDQDNMVARGRLSNVLISQHRFDEAEQIIRGIVALTGEDNALLHNLGLTLFYQKRFKDAWQLFKQAHDQGLQAPTNLAYQVYSLHMQNDTAQALKLAENWRLQAPGPATEGYIALVEMDHGDMDAARERAQKVIEQESGNADANTVLGTWRLERQQVDRAVAHFEQVVSSEPDNPHGWQGLGMAHMYRQHHAEALEALAKATKLMPDDPANHMMMGWVHMTGHDYEQAEKAFREAVRTDRDMGEAHGGLAAALVFQNRLEEAEAEIKLAKELDANGFGVVFAESVAMQLKGQGRQATRKLAEYLERPPLPNAKPLVDHIRHYFQTRVPANPTANRPPTALPQTSGQKPKAK